MFIVLQLILLYGYYIWIFIIIENLQYHYNIYLTYCYSLQIKNKYINWHRKYVYMLHFVAI